MVIKRTTNKTAKRDFESIDNILKKKLGQKGPVYAKHEFQDYGIRISEELRDSGHRSLYIKLAKEKPRGILDEARAFAKDYNTQTVNRGKLFMWKLKELEKRIEGNPDINKGD